jgi:ribosome biogenesis GTPase A
MPLDLSNVNVHWFPGHMAHGLKAMERRLEKATCLIELRDSRIPLSSANPLLSELVKRTGIRHFVAFNKVDLARSSPLRRAMDALRVQNVASMALRAAAKDDCRRLINNLIHYLSDLKHEVDKPIKIMVAGIPNVGKSTLINAIRAISCNTDVKAARTGKNPGVTRLISEQIKISDEPKVYLWDTPGILVPKISDPLVGMRLAATGAILDRQVGEFLIAEFLLEHLKGSKRLSLLLHVDSIPIDINAFLELYARRLAMIDKGGEVNITNAVRSFLSKFREGSFGKICLDDV